MNKQTDVIGADPANIYHPWPVDKFKISREVMDIASRCLADIMPALMHGQLYTTAELCGDEVWATLCPIKRRHIFHALKYISTGEELPLELMEPDEPGTLHFYLK